MVAILACLVKRLQLIALRVISLLARRVKTPSLELQWACRLNVKPS